MRVCLYFSALLPTVTYMTRTLPPSFPPSLPPSGAVPIESEAEHPEDFTQALGLSMALTAMLDIAVG